jgi:hypothetical protein
MPAGIGWVFRHVDTRNQRAAGCRSDKAREHPGSGTFAGTVGSEEAEDFSRGDLEADGIDRDMLAKGSGQRSGYDCAW